MSCCHSTLFELLKSWAGQVCVDQRDAASKQQAISALPDIITRSRRMLILWDDAYFERLFCSLEVSLFARNFRGFEHVDFVPLWMAPWLLCTVFVDLCCAISFQLREDYFSNWSTAYMPFIHHFLSSFFGADSGATVFGTYFMIGWFAGLGYLPAAIPSMFSFTQKLRRHALMLEQLSGYDVRRAKCTLASDRESIEAQISRFLD